MNIHRNNYEAFFLEYWENTLSKQDRHALEVFLTENPDLTDEFLDFKTAVAIRLSDTSTTQFIGKSSLTKPEIVPYAKIEENNYEDQIIAFLEDDLNADDLADYRIFISKNPQLALEEIAFRKTYLKADQQSIYPDKEQLKRQSPVVWFKQFYIVGTAVAASLILAFVLYMDFDNTNTSFNGKTYSQWEKPAQMIQAPLMPLPRIDETARQIIRTKQIKEEVKLINHRDMALADLSRKQQQNKLARQEANAAFASARKPETLSQIPSISANKAEASLILASEDPEPRTEMSAIAGDIFLRDAMRFAEKEKNRKSALQRVWANLTNELFGKGTNSEGEPSLLNQMAELGKERISDFATDLPRFETIEEDGNKKTYFAINENFNIQINKKRTHSTKE